MYEVFVKLAQENGVTAYKVAKATGISQQTFTDWKNGRSTPKVDKLQKIADYFGVTLDYLLGRESPCPVCGLNFYPSIPEEVERHNKIHAACLKAIEKYGFFWTYKEREEKKALAYRTLDDPRKTRKEKMLAAEDICKAYFSRCLQSYEFDLSHPSFDKYTAMLLNQDHFKQRFSSVYSEMVNKYGVLEGIPEGKTYIVNDAYDEDLDEEMEEYIDADAEFKTSVSDNDLRIALFDGDKDVTPEMWEEVKNYAKYVLQNRKNYKFGNNKK